MYKDIILDVGANSGQFSLEAAARNPDKLVIAFEPIPELAFAIRDSASRMGLSNVTVSELAICDSGGRLPFYVSKKGDWGTSSLLQFNAEVVNSDPYWSIREDLEQEVVIEINATTLEAFLDSIEFTGISFIKIDVQGMDAVVLRSLGKYTGLVKAGMLELPATKRCALYRHEEEDLRSGLNLLHSMGFSVYAIKPNDPAANEFNIYFAAADVDVNGHEEKLSFRGMAAYDGKFFWHLPSSKPAYVNEELERAIGENVRLQERIVALDKEILRLNSEVDRLNPTEQ